MNNRFLFLRLNFLLVYVLFLFGCFLLPKEDDVLIPPLREAPPVSYSIIEAKKGIIEKRNVYMGYLVFIDPSDVYFTYQGGRLKGIYAEMGDQVREGVLLAELDTEIIEEEIITQELLLEKMTLIAEKKKAMGSDRYDIRLAEIDVSLARHRLNILEKGLNQSRIYAPITAEVVYAASIDEGEYVNPFQTIFLIADPKELQVEYKGESAKDFRLGLEVGITIQGQIRPARVVQTPHDLPADAPEILSDMVRISMETVPTDIKLDKGDYVQITLVQLRKEGVLVIPKSSVNSHFNRNYVDILVNDLRQERDVEIGIETSTEVEVLSGLEIGDRIILR